jgi:hypothetical protein
MYKYTIALLLGSASLLGCATTDTKFSRLQAVAQNDALVYVYRSSAPPYAKRPVVSVNGKRLVSLKNNGYIDIRLPPGRYEFTANWAWNALSRIPRMTARFDAGKRYFVRVAPPLGMGGIYTTGQQPYDKAINIVDEADALPELSGCNALAGFEQADIQPLK